MTRILFVVDEPSYRDMIIVMLEHEGFEAKAAKNADEAIAIAESFRPDLLVVDWMLGDQTDGIQIAEAIIEVNPALPCIVISGYPSPELESRVARIPHTRFLAKPFRFFHLLEIVHQSLDNHAG